MAQEVGFEPTTYGLEDRCSIQLSYSCRINLKIFGLTKCELFFEWQGKKLIFCATCGGVHYCYGPSCIIHLYDDENHVPLSPFSSILVIYDTQRIVETWIGLVGIMPLLSFHRDLDGWWRFDPDSGISSQTPVHGELEFRRRGRSGVLVWHGHTVPLVALATGTDVCPFRIPS